MTIKADEISKIIKDQLGDYSLDVDVAEVGTVVSVGDGIARLHALKEPWQPRCSSFRMAFLGLL